MVVLLDNIRSLHNVGSIFRTADGAGVEKLYLCGITPSPLDRFGAVRSDVAKVALGAQESVPWEKRESTEECIDELKKQGFMIVALEQDARAIPYYEVKAPRDDRGVALVLGEEVHGLAPEILAKCDTIIEIPMSGSKESLNVSVAFGIAIFALRDHLQNG